MFLLYSLLQTVQLRCKSLSSAIIIIIIIKSPLKISEKVAVGVVRDSRKLSGHP